MRNAGRVALGLWNKLFQEPAEKVVESAPLWPGCVEPPEWEAGFIKALFLDFDGVLHRGNSGTLRHLPILEQYLHRWPDVGVVVISDWRIGATLESLKGYFSDEFRPRVFARTAEYPAGPNQRQEEVQDMVRRAGIHHYLVIDDDPDLYSSQFEPLLCPDPGEGLTSSDLERVGERIASWSRTI